jgi:hypothetical protein
MNSHQGRLLNHHEISFVFVFPREGQQRSKVPLQNDTR